MTKFRPASTFLGCFSLLVGVEVIALLELVLNVSVIALASSKDPLEILGVTIGPSQQVWSAALALIGIPIAIGAGVGALYRVEMNLRILLLYMTVWLVMNAIFFVTMVFTGNICSYSVHRDMQRMGNSFVCGFVETFFFFWVLIMCVIQLYLMYVVWSAAEEMSETAYPELIRYSEALKAIKPPKPTKGPHPLGSKPAMAKPVTWTPPSTFQPAVQRPVVHHVARPPIAWDSPMVSGPPGPPMSPGRPMVSGPPGPPMVSGPPMTSGAPQSFFPSPASGSYL